MKICCIIGHRNFEKSKELEFKLKTTLIDLIENKNVTTFLFGSKSNFVDFCYEVLSSLMDSYSNLKRVYVRAEYPVINSDYKSYLLRLYEDSYFFSKNSTTNKYSYIKRNQTMIDSSDFCLFFYSEKYKIKTQSGTQIAYAYAVKKNKKIININDI